MERIPSQRIRSSDAQIVYWVLGEGPPVVCDAQIARVQKHHFIGPERASGRRDEGIK